MTQIELAKKALDNIQDECFFANVYASEGGTCGGGWDDSEELNLSRKQLLSLIRSRIDASELFEGMTLEDVDVDDLIADMAMEAAWPDGGPEVTVNDAIPDELSELDKALDNLDMDDAEEVETIRKQLKEVAADTYTFWFTIEAPDYCFADDVKAEIKLTSEQALGLLRGRHDFDTLFDGICDKCYDEDLVNAKARSKGIADEYDSFTYGGESEGLEGWLEAWSYILDSILSGDITENEVDSWLEYFDDSDNYEMEISDWYEEQDEE